MLDVLIQTVSLCVFVSCSTLPTPANVGCKLRIYCVLAMMALMKSRISAAMSAAWDVLRIISNVS